MICNVCGNEYNPKKKNDNSSELLCANCRAMYRKIKMKRRLIEYKGGKCEICGYSRNDNAFDFHHVNPEEKDYIISGRYNNSFEALKKEVDKCMLLCANCHRELHANMNKK